jgi:protein gp37
MANTKIEWTDRTWNPITGCDKISEGCLHCYAKPMASRLQGRYGYHKENPFQVTIHDEAKFCEPYSWKKPSMVFVCSMGDLFHEDVPEKELDKVFAIAATLPQHKFLFLTKRPERMKAYLLQEKKELAEKWVSAIYELPIADKHDDSDAPACYIYNRREQNWPLANIWLGVTTENQERANERIPSLLMTPAAKRFISVEPMLGPVDLINIEHKDSQGKHVCFFQVLEPLEGYRPRIDWVICGGETGRKARPIEAFWVRKLKDQCQEKKVPFFFKSWGKAGPVGAKLDGSITQQFPEDVDNG